MNATQTITQLEEWVLWPLRELRIPALLAQMSHHLLQEEAFYVTAIVKKHSFCFQERFMLKSVVNGVKQGVKY